MYIVTLEKTVAGQRIMRCPLTAVSSCHLPETRELLDAGLMQITVASYLSLYYHVSVTWIFPRKDSGKR